MFYGVRVAVGAAAVGDGAARAAGEERDGATRPGAAARRRARRPIAAAGGAHRATARIRARRALLPESALTLPLFPLLSRKF